MANEEKRESIHYSNHWEFYMTRMDDQLMSIRVDVDAKKQGEEGGDTLLVRVPYEAMENGFPGPSERERLNKIEDRLADELLNVTDSVYQVGVVTTQGKCDFVYVSAKSVDFGQMVDEILSDVPHNTGVFPDDGWGYYDAVLYPSTWDWNRIYNRKVCYSLEEQGDALTTPREVDFFAVFETEENARQFAKEIGDRMAVEEPRETENAHYQVHFKANLIPTLEQMNTVTEELMDLAESHGGVFDGWGTTTEKA